jgi:hypothetical protein
VEKDWLLIGRRMFLVLQQAVGLMLAEGMAVAQSGSQGPSHPLGMVRRY